MDSILWAVCIPNPESQTRCKGSQRDREDIVTQAKVSWKVGTCLSWGSLSLRRGYPVKGQVDTLMLQTSVTYLYCKGFLNHLERKLNISQWCSRWRLGGKMSWVCLFLSFQYVQWQRNTVWMWNGFCVYCQGGEAGWDWHTLHPSLRPCQTKQLSMVRSHALFPSRNGSAFASAW